MKGAEAPFFNERFFEIVALNPRLSNTLRHKRLLANSHHIEETFGCTLIAITREYLGHLYIWRELQSSLNERNMS